MVFGGRKGVKGRGTGFRTVESMDADGFRQLLE
jgi:hypothetical protein